MSGFTTISENASALETSTLLVLRRGIKSNESRPDLADIPNSIFNQNVASGSIMIGIDPNLDFTSLPPDGAVSFHEESLVVSGDFKVGALRDADIAESAGEGAKLFFNGGPFTGCLLYTSDAADE